MMMMVVAVTTKPSGMTSMILRTATRTPSLTTSKMASKSPGPLPRLPLSQHRRCNLYHLYVGPTPLCTNAQHDILTLPIHSQYPTSTGSTPTTSSRRQNHTSMHSSPPPPKTPAKIPSSPPRNKTTPSSSPHAPPPCGPSSWPRRPSNPRTGSARASGGSFSSRWACPWTWTRSYPRPSRRSSSSPP